MSKVFLLYPDYLIKDTVIGNLPLGLLHIASWIESKGHEVRLLDCNVTQDWDKQFDEMVTWADVVGVSAMTIHLPAVKTLTERIRANKDFKGQIVLGGVHATLFPHQTVESGLFDYIVIGEGEVPFLSLLEALEQGQPVKDILGIGFLNDTEEIQVNAQDHSFNFPDMPYINYDLLDNYMVDSFKSGSIGVLSSRGCPFKCTFCINATVEGAERWRSWSVERTIDEIERVLEKYHPNTIWFWDEHFFVSKKRIIGLLDEIEKRGLKFEWAAEIRADNLVRMFDDELMQKMRNCGCIKLAMGAESGSEKMLAVYNKRIRPEMIYQAAEKCIRHDIQPTFSFIIGAPGEDRHDVAKTLEMFKRLLEIDTDIRILGPQMFRPYPGSPLHDECVKAGLKMPESVDEWIVDVKENMTESDPFSSPWLQEPAFMKTAWFYSYLLTAEFKTLRKLFKEYSKKTNKSALFTYAGMAGIMLFAMLGRLRYRYNLHFLQVEIALFIKYRAVLSL